MKATGIKTGVRIVVLAIAAACVAPASAQLFGPGSLIQVQAPHKGGRQGPPPDRGFERRGPPPGERPQPQPDRRGGQMTDDERRSLNQDLDKANRELYRRRFPQ